MPSPVNAISRTVFTLLPLLTGKGCEHHGQILAETTWLIDAGKLKPIMDPRRFDLHTANAAYDLLASGAQGRLAIDI
jgi:NADPH:quinone reductase-like Zn-dependent oxidoreductase